MTDVGKRELTTRERRWSIGVWSSWLGLFLLLELLGWKSRRAPWRTLSETAWDAGDHVPAMKMLLDGGLEVLQSHIRDPYWPGKPPAGPHY